MTDLRNSRFCVGVGLILTLATCIASGAYPQQRKTAAISKDDLLKSIGVVRVPWGSSAPDFALKGVSGNTVSLSGYRGNLLFLNFWATWCGPCRDEMPSMERLYRELAGQGLAVVAVNVKENGAQVASFMRNHGLTFPALLDLDGRVSTSYRVWGLPATYLVDASQIIGMKSGARDWASRQVVDVFRVLLGDRTNSTGMAGFLDTGPVEALPASLRVKSRGSVLFSQQDAQSEPVAKLEQGEELSPLGKASGAGEAWYMVKSKTGAAGWIRGGDVEEKSKTK